MTTVKAAPKAAVEPSTTSHLGPRAVSSPVDDGIEARLPPDLAEFIQIRGRTSSDRNRSDPKTCCGTRLSGASSLSEPMMVDTPWAV
jgi:hypothetical protein